MSGRGEGVRIGLGVGSAYLAEHVRRIAQVAGARIVSEGAVDVWVVDRVGEGGAVALGSPPDVPVVRIREEGQPRPAVAAYSPTEGTVLELPSDDEVILRFLGGLALRPRARTIGVVGARGGAGASTVAAAVARAAVRAGTSTALADLDAASGGLDLLLGIEHAPGPRWADLRAERAGFPSDALSMALPRWEAVRVLSGDSRGGVRPGDPGVHDALRALVSEHDLVVLDLPRNGHWGRDGAVAGAPACHVVLVVALCDVRSAAAAALAGRELSGHDVRLVVRSPGPGGLAVGDFVAACGLPLAATTRTERGAVAATERGEAPGDHKRGSVARTAARLVADLALRA